MRHQRLIAWVLLAVASAGTVVVPIEAITPAAVAAAADTLPTKICQVDADFCGQDQQLITDGSAAAALTNRDPLVAVGQLLDVALSPASLAVDGYDTQQLVALKNAWPAIMNAGPAVVQAYLESSEIPDGTNGQPDILHKVLGLTEQPRIDIRAIQTLNYVTTPTALNGGGIPWGVVIRDVKATPNIIAHEMSHKNLANTTTIQAGTITYPRWFDEGLANYLGNMDYYDDLPELRETLNEGRYRRDITGWKGVQGNVTWIYHTFYGVGPRILYGQTYQMIKFLIDSYGEEKVQKLVNLVRHTSFEKAFVQTFGKTSETFHQEFIATMLAN